MKSILLGLSILLLSLPVQAKTILSIETDEAGKLSKINFPELSDLEAFWAINDMVAEIILLDRNYREKMINALMPLAEDENISGCFIGGSCSEENQIAISKAGMDAVNEVHADPFTYRGQGFKVVNTYLGLNGSAVMDMYDFTIETSPIFNVSKEEFILRSTTYYCTELEEGELTWLKSISVIRGITPVPFNLELSHKICEQLSTASK